MPKDCDEGRDLILTEYKQLLYPREGEMYLEPVLLNLTGRFMCQGVERNLTVLTAMTSPVTLGPDLPT